ncbi:MAG: PEP-CTERM sorting domain-containing protein [Planctomycetota bacterium]
MRKLLLSAMLLCMLTGNAFANFITYDANAQFDGTPDGTNGFWQYGYSNLSVSNSITNFTAANQFNDGNAFGLSLNPPPNYTPGIFKTKRDNWPYNGATNGMFAMHSGQTDATQYSVLRFTAQTAGLYNLDVKWFAGDSRPLNAPTPVNGRVDVFVNQNSSSLASAVNTLSDGSFNASGISLNAGDYFELRVGRGNEGYTYDTTPVEMTVTSVPEPSTLACVSGLVAGLSVLSRRRRQA